MDFKLKKSNLNLSVYTATATPETGDENDIVVISETPMVNWILSPSAPKGAPRNDGDVWIRYSVTGNTFDILNDNSMMIATISAKQYVNGEWVDKEAKTYRNGDWENWIIYLYDHGDECTNYTGGWEACAYARGNARADGKKAPTVTISDGVVTLEMQDQKWSSDRNVRYSGGYFTKKPVEMANKKTLKINVLSYSAGEFLSPGGVTFGITSALQNEFTPVASVEITDIGKYTLDVPYGTQPCYVYVHIQNPTTAVAKISFDEIVG